MSGCTRKHVRICRHRWSWLKDRRSPAAYALKTRAHMSFGQQAVAASTNLPPALTVCLATSEKRSRASARPQRLFAQPQIVVSFWQIATSLKLARVYCKSTAPTVFLRICSHSQNSGTVTHPGYCVQVCVHGLCTTRLSPEMLFVPASSECPTVWPLCRWCAHPDCGSGQLVDQGDEYGIMRCAQCNGKTCYTHRIVYHDGLTCQQYDSQLKASSDAAALTARYMASTRNCKSCPKCGVAIDKNGGCDHMTCRMCKHQFCWRCLADYKSILTNSNAMHRPTCLYYHP